MDLARALRLTFPRPSRLAPSSGSGAQVIAFVGAGGKTTAIFQLAQILTANMSRPVIVSATSHLGAWQLQLAGHHMIALKHQDLDALPDSGIALVTGELDGDRANPLSPDLIQRLSELCRARNIHLLIEADGSRGQPLKAPAAHEPPIPEFTDQVVVVAGLSGLALPLTGQAVHRPQLFAALSGLSPGEPVTPEALVHLLIHPEGGLKNIPPAARRVVLLNQAETPRLQSIGGSMAQDLLEAFDAVLVGSLQEKAFQTFELTAGIILAAGESTRFGKPKQLLDWRGQPFVRAVARTALEAGLNPVIVVTGAHAGQVEDALGDLPVTTVRNPEWREGQAGSIRAGIHALGSPMGSARSGAVGSAIFLLVDQPQVTMSVLSALMEAHTHDIHAVIAPLVVDRRANPILFDRVTFGDLLRLQGDVGGRGIFDKHRVEYLPWHDDRLLLDVDTPEQYARLLEDETL